MVKVPAPWVRVRALLPAGRRPAFLLCPHTADGVGDRRGEGDRIGAREARALSGVSFRKDTNPIVGPRPDRT